jgi:heme/copper-type cytochrome/quinol oxidase subunit 2
VRKIDVSFWKLVAFLLLGSALSATDVHVIQVIADKDSRYKIEGLKKPEITVKAGEAVLLKITARKGKSWNRDGTIHGFTLLRTSDRSKVKGWNLVLMPGEQQFEMTAPAEPGDYIVVCTVICSEEHEGMNMKFTVVP